MTTEREPLTAEEAALAAHYRALPAREPSAALDAAVLAQARAAVAAPRRRPHPLTRWGLSAAAAAVLSVVIVGPWIRDEASRPSVAPLEQAPAKTAPAPAAVSADAAPGKDAAATDAGRAAVDAGTVAGNAAVLAEPAAKATAPAAADDEGARGEPAAATSYSVSPPAAADLRARDAARTQSQPPQPFPAEPPAAPAPPVLQDAPVPQPVEAPAPAMQERAAAEPEAAMPAPAAAEAPPPPPAAPAPALTTGITAGAPRRAAATERSDAYDEAREAPRPAAAKEEARQAGTEPAEQWLQRIRALAQAGREAEARRELALFVEHHPQHPIPPDLHPLRPPAP